MMAQPKDRFAGKMVCAIRQKVVLMKVTRFAGTWTAYILSKIRHAAIMSGAARVWLAVSLVMLKFIDIQELPELLTDILSDKLKNIDQGAFRMELFHEWDDVNKLIINEVHKYL